MSANTMTAANVKIARPLSDAQLEELACASLTTRTSLTASRKAWL